MGEIDCYETALVLNTIAKVGQFGNTRINVIPAASRNLSQLRRSETHTVLRATGVAVRTHVGAGLCARPETGAHRGAPLHTNK